MADGVLSAALGRGFTAVGTSLQPIANALLLDKIKSGKIAKGYKGNTPSESLYVNEMKNFITCVKRKKTPNYTFNDELKILKVLDAIEQSNKQSKKISLKK